MKMSGISESEHAALVRVYGDLRRLADHPTPHVRSGVRIALAEVAQILNALGDPSELYTNELSI